MADERVEVRFEGDASAFTRALPVCAYCKGTLVCQFCEGRCQHCIDRQED